MFGPPLDLMFLFGADDVFFVVVVIIRQVSYFLIRVHFCSWIAFTWAFVFFDALVFFHNNNILLIIIKKNYYKKNKNKKNNCNCLLGCIAFTVLYFDCPVRQFIHYCDTDGINCIAPYLFSYFSPPSIYNVKEKYAYLSEICKIWQVIVTKSADLL